MATEVDALAALKEFKSQFDTDGDCASALAIDKQFLYQMVTGKRPVSPNVLRKLGLRKAVISCRPAPRRDDHVQRTRLASGWTLSKAERKKLKDKADKLKIADTP